MDKSQLFQFAHIIKNEDGGSFSEALRKAWVAIKILTRNKSRNTYAICFKCKKAKEHAKAILQRNNVEILKEDHIEGDLSLVVPWYIRNLNISVMFNYQSIHERVNPINP